MAIWSQALPIMFGNDPFLRFPDIDATNDSATATRNTTKLQAALTAGGLVQITTPGPYYLAASTLTIYSNTQLELAEGVELIQYGGGTAYTMLVNAALSRSTTSVTIAGSTSSLTATVTETAHGRAVGSYVWLRGAAQTAYVGVFEVLAITDANTYTVRLKRFPTAAPATGTITATTPDSNISISGGKWDNNSAVNTAAASTQDALCMKFGGIENFRMPGTTRFGSSLKFALCVAAMANWSIGRIIASKTASDVVKCYGPLFNGEIESVTGISGDDLLTIHPIEDDIYVNYRYSFGSILGLKVGSLTCNDSATSVFCVFSDTTHDADDIEIESIEGTSTASVPIRLEPNPTTASGTIGRITIGNVNCAKDTTALNVKTGQTIRSLRLLGMNHLPTAVGAIGVKIENGAIVNFLEVGHQFANSTVPDATAYMIDIEGTVNEARVIGGTQFCRGAGVNLTTNAVVKSLVVADWNCVGADFPLRIQGAAAVDNVLLVGGSDVSPAANARCLVIEGSGVKVATVRNRALGASMNSAIIVNAGVTNTPNINVENCTLDGTGTVNVSSSCVINLSNNRVASNANGVIRTGGTPALIINTYNTNVTAGRLITIPTGFPTISLNTGGGENPGITTQSVAFGAAPALDCSLGNNVTLSTTLTSGITWGAPTNVVARGQSITISMVQDGTGGRAVAWNAAYVFPTAWSNAGNTAGLRSTVVFVANEKGQLVAQNTNTWY